MSLPNNIKSELEEVARIILDKMRQDLGITNFDDPFKVISLLDNYIIIRYPSDDSSFKSQRESFSGFSTIIDDYKCIYINSNHVLGRQYFSCWHEFYHSIDDLTNLTKEEYAMEEEKADHFALSMLLPSEKIDRYLAQVGKRYDDLDLDDLISMQNTLRVSLLLLIRRLTELYGYNYYIYSGIASPKKANEFKAKTQSLGFDTDLITPTNDIVLPKKFIDAMVANIKSNRIDINKANYILNILEEKEVKFLW